MGNLSHWGAIRGPPALCRPACMPHAPLLSVSAACKQPIGLRRSLQRPVSLFKPTDSLQGMIWPTTPMGSCSVNAKKLPNTLSHGMV